MNEEGSPLQNSNVTIFFSYSDTVENSVSYIDKLKSYKIFPQLY